MCIVLAVDHIPCTHTVAIWQHCINAARSAQGLKPCSRIRQHARPILTRKFCVHCGGPRYFARRGGIAGRGSGSPTTSNASEEKDDLSESYDSGYHSDVIHEEDEGDNEESVLSPTASLIPAKKSREAPKQRSSSTPRSLSSRRPSWRPNLKRDLSAEHISYRNDSVDSTLAMFEEESSVTSRSHSPPEDLALPECSIAPILRRPQPKRKSSTLLHPSSPPLEPMAESENVYAITLADFTPPTTPPQRPSPIRLGSSLLHPSSPNVEPTMAHSKAMAFPFNFSLPMSKPSPQPPTSAPAQATRRPGLTPRKNSTLLHPSPPPESPPTTTSPFILPIHAKTILRLPPTPLATPTTDSFQLRRSPSIIRSSLSDDEWEEPLHSSHSDGEDDSDGCSADADATSFQKMPVARTARMARASRISLLSDGNALRILQDCK